MSMAMRLVLVAVGGIIIAGLVLGYPLVQRRADTWRRPGLVRGTRTLSLTFGQKFEVRTENYRSTRTGAWSPEPPVSSLRVSAFVLAVSVPLLAWGQPVVGPMTARQIRALTANVQSARHADKNDLVLDLDAACGRAGATSNRFRYRS